MLTKAQAIQLAQSNWWETVAPRDVAIFQIHEDTLCMPFPIFHECVEKALGRPVWTHEFGLNRDGLIKELLGEQPLPTFEEILNLIPAEKRILIVPT